MYFVIYKITNLVNGKYYIGKHQTKDLDDGYFGSGKLIKAAIKKHGIENFTKEILFVFETEDEMNKKEAELVTEDLIASGLVYNLCPGGNGGFGYINENGLNLVGVDKRDYQEIGKKSVSTRRKNGSLNHSKISKDKISAANAFTNESRGKKVSAALTGKRKSEEHKKKISESLKRRRNNAGML